MPENSVLWCVALMLVVGLVSTQNNNNNPNNNNNNNNNNPQQPPANNQCLPTFVQNIQACFQKGQIQWPNFVFMISNGSRGNNPGNPDTFKKTICPKQKDLFGCGVEFMRKLINSSLCLTNTMDLRENLDFQFRSLFAALDDMCAHPCRRTLQRDLRQCYVDANLDADLFLSNSSMGRGAVIGATTDQAKSFCQNKDALISCMKQRRDDCPEAPMILRAIGLDIESLDVGVSVLCKHQSVYLTGVECFAEPTDGVIQCQRSMAKSSFELMVQAQKTKMPQPELFKNLCGVRLTHVTCDLDAWGKKSHKSCNEVVLGLRTELECSLLPDECSSSHKAVIDKVCHVDNFKKEQRFSAGGSTVTMAALPVVILSAVLARL